MMLVFRLHKVSPFLSSVLIFNSTILTSIIQVSRVQEGCEDVAGPQKPIHQPTHQPPSRPNNCSTIFNLPQNLKSCTTKQPTGTQYIATEKSLPYQDNDEIHGSSKFEFSTKYHTYLLKPLYRLIEG